MSRSAFPITTFQNPDGSPVANGAMNVRLSSDGTSNAQQIQHNFTSVPLDSNGVVTGSPAVWADSVVLPDGRYYVINVYSQKGQLVAGPLKIEV